MDKIQKKKKKDPATLVSGNNFHPWEGTDLASVCVVANVVLTGALLSPAIPIWTSRPPRTCQIQAHLSSGSTNYMPGSFTHSDNKHSDNKNKTVTPPGPQFSSSNSFAKPPRSCPGNPPPPYPPPRNSPPPYSPPAPLPSTSHELTQSRPRLLSQPALHCAWLVFGHLYASHV